MIKGMEHIEFSSGRIETFNLETKRWSALDPVFNSTIIADFDIAKTSAGYAMVVACKDGKVFLRGDTGEDWNEVFQRKDDYISKLAFSPEYVFVRSLLLYLKV